MQTATLLNMPLIYIGCSICHQAIHLIRRKELIGLSDNHPVHYRETLETFPVCILCFVSLVSEHSTAHSPSVFSVLNMPVFFHVCTGHRILSTTQPVNIVPGLS